MAITGLVTTPTTVLVKETVTLIPQGQRVGNSLRYYLESAPTGSALKTIETLTGLETFEEALLKTDKAGRGLFSPDVPGKYVAQVRDVTETVNIPTYDGEEFPTGDSDNADVAPTVSVTLWVAEVRSRRIGEPPTNFATLSVRTYDDEVDPWARDAVKFTPNPQSPIALTSQYTEDVLTVLDAIRTEASPLTFQTSLADIFNAIHQWNDHVQSASAFSTHGLTDLASSVVVANATDLASALTLLNSIKSSYEGHRVKTASIHSGADSTNVITSPNATDLASARTLWRELWIDVNNHAVNAVHVSAPFDGMAKEWKETPTSEELLVERTNQLKSLYNAHLAKSVNTAVHAAADAENVVALGGVSALTVDGLVELINGWGHCMFRHGLNLKANGEEASTPYHNVSSTVVVDDSLKSPFSASSLDNVFQLAEILMFLSEQHMRNTAFHTDGGLGSFAIPNSSRTLTMRLSYAWKLANQPGQLIIPKGFNSLATTLVTQYGWT